MPIILQKMNKRSADSVPGGIKVKVIQRSDAVAAGVSYFKVAAIAKSDANSGPFSVGRDGTKKER